MLKVKQSSLNADKVIADIDKSVKPLRKPRNTRIGFFSDARYHEGSRPHVASVAMWQEFESVKRKEDGTPRKPARPFMREAIENPDTKAKVRKLLKQYLVNPGRVMGLIGEHVKGAIQKSISTGPWAPLAESTIARRRKKSDKPLEDTGFLRSSVTYRVDD